jgi:septal ring factor EnvC (AmiA/AmiB activator)
MWTKYLENRNQDLAEQVEAQNKEIDERKKESSELRQQLMENQQQTETLMSMVAQLQQQMQNLTHSQSNEQKPLEQPEPYEQENPKKRPNNKRTPVKAPSRTTMPRNAPGSSLGNTDQVTTTEDMEIQPQQLHLEDPTTANEPHATMVSDTDNIINNSEPQTPSRSKAAGDEQNE